jgi:hypothetical protein
MVVEVDGLCLRDATFALEAHLEVTFRPDRRLKPARRVVVGEGDRGLQLSDRRGVRSVDDFVDGKCS